MNIGKIRRCLHQAERLLRTVEESRHGRHHHGRRRRHGLGDAVRVKILPDRERLYNVFVGSGPLANFHDSASSLAQKYGYEIDAGWVTLGQVNLSRVSEKPMSIPIGNGIEDSFEQLALAVNDIVRVAGAVRFPAVSSTPITSTGLGSLSRSVTTRRPLSQKEVGPTAETHLSNIVHSRLTMASSSTLSRLSFL